ncbi:MAG: siroheme decarboxylase subunit beta [Pseudomonadota bacterium]
MSRHEEFSDLERRILQIIQKNLPHSLTPYADIAAEVGTDEETVLALLRSLKEEGAIRRFGASIKHQKTGWSHNAMVAWKVPTELVDEAGAAAAKHPLISHAYHRPSSASDWPYILYTMIHGRHESEHLEVIEQLRRETVLDEYAVLESLEELKKTSMTYF